MQKPKREIENKKMENTKDKDKTSPSPSERLGEVIFDSKSYMNMELLRFTTAGSVDDGKSTLIGRLLKLLKAPKSPKGTLALSLFSMLLISHFDVCICICLLSPFGGWGLY